MGERRWVREIGKQLRDDMGDCPTLPEDMLELLRKLDRLQAATSGPMKPLKPVKGPAKREPSSTA
jgi:hypothetical protein